MTWLDTPESSNIARFRYVEQTNVLTVEFKNAGRYDYYDVPQEIYEGMKRATSKGQYLAQNIKSRFRYARV